jgi:flagellar motor switch protein FliN/FliY
MPDDSEQVGQDEIEALLQQAKDAKPAAPESPPPDNSASDSAGDDTALDQSEIEALLSSSSGGGKRSQPARRDVRPEPAAASAPAAGEVAGGDVELLLGHAEEALKSAIADSGSPPPNVSPFRLQDFTGTPPSTEMATLDLIRDVELDLKIELGRTHMYLEDVLKLRKGSVVPLEKLAGDPVDIYVNGRLVARGEVLVLNDNFCVRVAELVTGEKMEVA